eukprot:TRINITY_DN93250_c0_g1_i1.p1 TRINITY_DN93250_c0_g1~~TRINITY_DN93250_c0_g1_i1.p1  ORF type:complete len:315 (+),score=55.70 TRINITY_DN93250_c0_g1_i1:99-1043(+)
MAILGTTPLVNGSTWSKATDVWSRQTSSASPIIDDAPFARLSEDSDSDWEDNVLMSKTTYRGSNKISTSTRCQADWRPMFSKTSSCKNDTAARDSYKDLHRETSGSTGSAPTSEAVHGMVRGSKAGRAREQDDREPLYIQVPASRHSETTSPSGNVDVDCQPVFDKISSSKADDASLGLLLGGASSSVALFGKTRSGDALPGKSGDYANTLRARGEAIRHRLHSDYRASAFCGRTRDKPLKQKSHQSSAMPPSQPDLCTGSQPILATGALRLASTLGSVGSFKQQCLVASTALADEINRCSCANIQQKVSRSGY